MLQPKAYSKEKQKVYDVKYIDFDNETLELLTEQQFDFYAHVYDFDEVEFMENTGMKDKNGKYIYTGDIVSFKDSHLDGYNFTNFAVIRKDIKLYLENFLCVQSCIKEEMAEMYLEVYDFEEGYFEVIGNIYENKELLKNE